MNDKESKPQYVLRVTCISLITSSIILLAVVIIISIIQQRWSEINLKFIFTGAVLLGTSASILACVIAYSDNNIRFFALSGIATGFVSILLWLLVIWSDSFLYDKYEVVWRLAISFTLIMIASTATSQLLSLKTRFYLLSISRYLVGVVWFSSFAMIILMIYKILPFKNPMGGGPSILLLTVVVPSVISAIVGTIILTIIIRITEKRAVINAETIPTKIELKFTCPKCEHWQSHPTGPGTCINCKALLNIEVEEPRCDCGYLLYKLSSINCPECGIIIPKDQRWLTAHN